jgi:hypothetical protein
VCGVVVYPILELLCVWCGSVSYPRAAVFHFVNINILTTPYTMILRTIAVQ